MATSKRDYTKEYESYQGTDAQKKNRAVRNAARRKLTREGKVTKGDGNDVDHKTPLSKGGANGSGNLRVVSKSKNRSFSRNPDSSVKRNSPKK
jgi:5-methylcytosine-specific restriction endonuclease McrA